MMPMVVVTMMVMAVVMLGLGGRSQHAKRQAGDEEVDDLHRESGRMEGEWGKSTEQVFRCN